MESPRERLVAFWQAEDPPRERAARLSNPEDYRWARSAALDRALEIAGACRAGAYEEAWVGEVLTSRYTLSDQELGIDPGKFVEWHADSVVDDCRQTLLRALAGEKMDMLRENGIQSTVENALAQIRRTPADVAKNLDSIDILFIATSATFDWHGDVLRRPDSRGYRDAMRRIRARNVFQWTAKRRLMMPFSEIRTAPDDVVAVTYTEIVDQLQDELRRPALRLAA